MNTTFSDQATEETFANATALSEAKPAEFTEQDIRAAYAKARTGTDFPRLIQDLKKLGIVSYDHMLESGSNVFHGQEGRSISLSNMGPSVPVNDQADVELLKKHISEHQRGLTNYPTLCGLAGQAGVDKWMCDLLAMTCNYFDRSGCKLHVEFIPTGEYEKK
jgi:uncharacterized protein YbcV (DUF1398 family)